MSTLYIILGLLILVIVVDFLSKKKKVDSAQSKQDIETLIAICDDEIAYIRTEHPDCIDDYEYWFEKKWEYQKMLKEIEDEEKLKKH